MVERAILLRKVGELRRYTGDVRRLLLSGPGAGEPAEDRRDLVAFRLLLAIQNAIDLAMHLVADRGEAVPGSYREAFEILERVRLRSEIPRHLAALEQFAALVAAAV